MKGKIFNAQEVQAIIAGKKTQFREVIKKPHEIIESCIFKGQIIEEDSKPTKGFQAYFEKPKAKWLDENRPTGVVIKCPYQVGQKIFCKEKFVRSIFGKPIYFDEDFRWFQGKEKAVKWSSAQHMKQEQSRLTLQIKEIRTERLAEISEEDARKEGIIDGGCGNCGESEFVCKCEIPEPLPKESFFFNWNATHKKPEEKFRANPWVWVIGFEVVKND